MREVTLLGQNVNWWGRDLRGEERLGFADLLRTIDGIDGIERIRYTSPHPEDFRPEVIEAMAECASVCEHTHLPAQSGSTGVPWRVRRTYSREHYLRLVGDLRAAIPDLALTTDLIVGFPGETEGDFAQTISLVEEVGFDGAYTSVFSPRNGTEAAAMDAQVPEGVKRARIERLVETVQRVSAARNAARVGGSGTGARRGPQPPRRLAAQRQDPAQHDGCVLGNRRARRRGQRRSRSLARRRRRSGAVSTRSSQSDRVNVLALFGRRRRERPRWPPRSPIAFRRS